MLQLLSLQLFLPRSLDTTWLRFHKVVLRSEGGVSGILILIVWLKDHGLRQHAFDRLAFVKDWNRAASMVLECQRLIDPQEAINRRQNISWF